ncbi:MAG: SGNH/GDSL hydrolase family protein [Bacteroidota bacterium]
MRRFHFYTLLLWLFAVNPCFAAKTKGIFYPANDSNIQYFGRVDFSNPLKPKFWASGVYVKIKFSGSFCELQINDEMIYGSVNNYLEVQVDQQLPYRTQTTGKDNKIVLAKNLPDGEHTIVVCKNTEAENGYLELVGFVCEKLLAPPAKQKRRLEFIGDSITCGAASDESEIPCDKGKWHDQHNAYLAYGPTTARALAAQWQLSSVSGIGLMHSCCEKTILMPQVFDKINMAKDSLLWEFNRYQPDLVSVCLGQNDGIQDSVKFTAAYVKFVKTLRGHYPMAKIVLLSSPMASPGLNKTLQKYISAVIAYLSTQGEENTGYYFFSKSYNDGCGGHPSVNNHQAIAAELTAYLKKTMKW